ncbi:hypothetical protein MRX96_027206 [Rhipicephalus microplus]
MPTQGRQPSPPPSAVLPGPEPQVPQIVPGKPRPIGAPRISHTASQGSSPSAPVRPGQVSPGSSIVLSPELEIVGAGTGQQPLDHQPVPGSSIKPELTKAATIKATHAASTLRYRSKLECREHSSSH